MKIKIPQKLKLLAQKLNKPLYIVGGYVRNYLLSKYVSEDIDLSSPLSVEEMLPALKELDFNIIASYERTGTVVFESENQKYEFTSFRKDSYAFGGAHSPDKVERTLDIKEDALRRDFKCNAVYYNIKSEKIVDVLGGVKDIKNKVLDTVDLPEKVFSCDGLRLMRLARFAGELNFKPLPNVLKAALKYADNILDVVPERIYVELKKMLVCDSAYSFSNPQGHYYALEILDDIRVLDRILPELTLGRDMEQRADFHKYDVLEHSLRCVLYAKEEVRLGALFHDIGKPFCMQRDGKYHLHAVDGAKIAERVLSKFKASKAEIEEVCFLTEYHMLDIDLSMKESKIRNFIVLNYKYYDKLLKVKQADYRACMDSDKICPTVVKWQSIFEKMKCDGTPFSIKDLSITAKDLMKIGFVGAKLGKIQKKLFDICLEHPEKNEKQELLATARKYLD